MYNEQNDKIENRMRTNRLLMGVSVLPGKDGQVISCSEYEWQGKKSFAGYSQLEPIAQLLYEEKHKENAEECFEFILLCTNVSAATVKQFSHPKDIKINSRELTERAINVLKEEQNSCHYTSVEYLIHRIGYYITGKADFLKNGEEVGRNLFNQKQRQEFEYDITGETSKKNTLRFILIKIDEKHSEDGLKDALNYLKEECKEGDALWIDTHGGFREISMLMTSLVSLLRVYHIVPEKVLGVLHDLQNRSSMIVEQKQMLDINLFVAGMEEFVNYGSIRILKKYYDDLWNTKTVQTEDRKKSIEQTKEWLLEMEKIADGIQLCDLRLFRSGIADLKELVNSWSALEDSTVEEGLGLDAYLSIFVDYISRHLLLLRQECRNI